MPKLKEYTFIKDGEEMKASLMDYEDPYESVYIEKGWKVKTDQSKTAKEIINKNRVIMDPPIIDPKQKEKKEGIIDFAEVDITALNVNELKKFLDDHDIAYDYPKEKKAGLQQIATKFIEDANPG